MRATLTMLTEDRAEVLVQYLHGAKTGTPAYLSGFYNDAKTASSGI